MGFTRAKPRKAATSKRRRSVVQADLKLDNRNNPFACVVGARAGGPLAKIFGVMQSDNGQSFTGYKQAMLVRRIERRMGLLNIQKLEDYAKRLRRDGAEVTALRKDLLIGVTEFFRDRQAWQVLDNQVLRPLIAGKNAGVPIRAWVSGAGTGEEAYTLAILLLERLKSMRKRCGVQIFGTDVNEDSLSYARAGRYPSGIRSQISAELLKRYFQEVKDDHHYQITPQLRQSVIFGQHDLLTDPPFSRLDLVTCRNLLIYIEPATQDRILLLCHFALRPLGYLFLGSAETLGGHEKLFKLIDRKWRIYQSIGTTPRDQIAWPVGKGKRAEILHLTSSAERFLSRARPATKTSLLPRLPKGLRTQLPEAIRRVQIDRQVDSQLRQELRATQDDLQSAVNQLKVSNEELNTVNTQLTEAKRAAQAQIQATAAVNEELEKRVRERTEELGRLARELAFAEVRERQSIARDLHDGLGQELHVASIKLDALRNSNESQSTHPALDEIAQLVAGVVREMRSLTAQLNPPVLEQLGLIPAIEWLSEEMRRTYRLEVLLDDDSVSKPLDSLTASILFRAIRELLINVARHSKVKIASIATRRVNEHLTVEVMDRGAGFAAARSAASSMGGLGIATMRERIAYIGGTFQIDSAPNRGTIATIQVPVSRM